MSKIQSLSTLFIFLFLGSFVFAQESKVRDYPMEERALLWQIEGNGINSKSYLFGTVHLIDEEHFFFPKKLQKIVSKSDILTMEIAGLPNPMEALKLTMLEEGSFFDFFNKEQTDSIFVWVEANTSLTEKSFRSMADKMRPFVISQMLPELDESNPNRGMDNKKSYEKELEAIAKEKKMEVKGLETIAEQLGIFDVLSTDQQVEMVMATIRGENVSADDELEKIMALYGEQNVDGLHQMIADESDFMEGMTDILLYDRNKRWIPMIEAMISENDTFIAVGAGHLGGPEGVIRLLEAQGYTLTPIEL